MDKPKKRKWWIWLIVVVAVIAVVIFIVIQNLAAQSQAILEAMSGTEQSYTVARGTVEKTITATGQLSAPDQVLVKLPDGLMVEEILVSAGDRVSAGDPLARLDANSVALQLAYLADEVNKDDNRLATADEYDSIKAPAKGRIKYLPVNENDDVRTAMEQYGVLAILSSDGYMRLSIETDRELTLGERMEVQWDGGKAKGTVSRKTPNGYVILVPDDHAPYLKTATLMDGDTQVGSGTLEINMPLEVLAYDGIIRYIRYHLDESVPDGKEIFRLRVPPVSIAYANRYASRTKLAELYKKVIALSTNPYLTAPCDGVVGEVSLKQGALSGSTVNANVENTAVTLQTGGARILTVDVDELDVLSVMLGQQAEISLDTMADQVLAGEVTNISAVGTRTNSISVFPVEVTLDYDERLLAGMNGSATILVERAENVLLIPLMAVNEDGEGEFVMRKAADGTTERTAITTGRSDGDMVEVTEGLQEGDVITYTDTGMADAFFGAMGGGSVSATSVTVG